MMALQDYHCIKIAYLHADTAPDAYIGIDGMDFAPLTGDSIGRAVAGAYRAAGAGFSQDFIADQGFTNLGRAAFFVDMGFKLIAEMPENAFDGGRCTLPKAAQTGSSHLLAKHFQSIEVLGFAFASAN